MSKINYFKVFTMQDDVIGVLMWHVLMIADVSYLHVQKIALNNCSVLSL
jgi:hypothetical protein